MLPILRYTCFVVVVVVAVVVVVVVVVVSCLFSPHQIIETVLLTQPSAHTNWIKLLYIVGCINKSSVSVLSLGLILGSGGQLHCTVLRTYVRS